MIFAGARIGTGTPRGGAVPEACAGSESRPAAQLEPTHRPGRVARAAAGPIDMVLEPPPGGDPGIDLFTDV